MQMNTARLFFFKDDSRLIKKMIFVLIKNLLKFAFHMFMREIRLSRSFKY